MPDCFEGVHYIYRRHAICFSVFMLCSVFQSILAGTSQCPWRLDESFSEIDWLSFNGHQRSRIEALKGQFRSGREADVNLLAFRTALQADLSGEGFGFSAELMDSRQETSDDETPLGTSIVNAMELIQAHAVFDLSKLRDSSNQGQLKVGRYTMDLGTRRFVARNRYRNTVNNFTGIHGTWMVSGGEKVQLFYTLPVHRLPTDRGGLLHNRIRLDEEDFDVQFWGVYVEVPDFIGQAKGDVFVFGIHENDRPELPTSNRNFYTGGFRVYQSPQKGRGDFEIEAALQIGKSRASRSPADVTDLDHFAGFVHLEAGYTFDNNWQTRCVFQFDYASGDKDPNDNENNRWDTLYGARRFDYGPTGTYGTFARSNLISPAYRFTVTPHEQVNIMFAHRFHWLASDTDAWTTGGLRDVTGNSGSYLGNQPEIRVRWEAFPGNLRIEGGVVHLFAGEFLKLARNSNGQGDSTYGYLQSVFTF